MSDAVVGCEGNNGTALCAEDAIAIVHIACVHEHIGHPAACGRCLARTLVVIAEKRAVCTACRKSAQPHRCAIVEAAPPTFLDADLARQLPSPADPRRTP